MAKNFKKAGSTASFETVGRESSKFSQVPPIMMLRNEDIIDYPYNEEDVSNTEDIESSIRSFGFTDPIEVTDYGMEDGKYMIVSGHRRRASGVKCGITDFPCIVIHFPISEDSSYDPVADYVLMANSHRDSSKDPLLLARRYKRHKALLVAQGVRDFRKQLAERMGISVATASRLEAMSQIIPSVWEYVEADIVGMSSVVGMNQFTEEEQTEIFKIMSECSNANSYVSTEEGEEGVEKKGHISRETMKDIINGYRRGCRSWREIPKPLRDSGLPLDYDLDDDSPSPSPSSSESSFGFDSDSDFEDFDSSDDDSFAENFDNDSDLDDKEDDKIIEFGDSEDIDEKDTTQDEINLAESFFKHLKTVANDADNPDLCFDAVGIERAEEIIRYIKGVSLSLISTIRTRGIEDGLDYDKVMGLLSEIKSEVENLMEY